MICGLIGAGIQGSRSPALHEGEAKAQGLELSYRLIDLDVLGVGNEALPRLLRDAVREGYCGLNITFPSKQAVIPLLDGISEEAHAIGAGIGTGGRLHVGHAQGLHARDVVRVGIQGGIQRTSAEAT